MDEYFETFGGIRDYLGGIVDEARRSGFTETIRGRRRYLPDLTSDNRQRREMAERMALNAPDPGLGRRPDQDRDARRRSARSTRPGSPHGCCSRCTTSSCSRWRRGSGSALEALVREHMGAAAELAVPLDVSVGTGHSWHEAAH